MLGFFDYLRQRACDSILSGVEDALESLEKNSNGSQLGESPHKSVRAALAGNSNDTAHPDQGEEQRLGAGEEKAPQLPPPRRRGRPRKNRRS